MALPLGEKFPGMPSDATGLVPLLAELCCKTTGKIRGVSGGSKLAADLPRRTIPNGRYRSSSFVAPMAAPATLQSSRPRKNPSGGWVLLARSGP